jgi:thioesterase domain-containing protein
MRTRASGLFAPRDRALGWEAHVRGGLDTVIIPGAHTTCLHEPHVRAVAEVLRGYLAQASADRAGAIKPDL